jgi:RNA polymerase sigma-70 factor (ECF subfamily)
VGAASWSDSGARTGPHEIGLIAKIAAKNDGVAARRLYRKYRMELFRFGFHVLHDQGLAEEMVQETFIKFCQQSSNYDAKRGPVRGWLFTMARSAAYDIARRPSSRPLLPVEDFQLPPQYDTVDQALTVLTVDQALGKLPSIYADVMRLVRDGFTQSEIAGRLGIRSVLSNPGWPRQQTRQRSVTSAGDTRPASRTPALASGKSLPPAGVQSTQRDQRTRRGGSVLPPGCVRRDTTGDRLGGR